MNEGWTGAYFLPMWRCGSRFHRDQILRGERDGEELDQQIKHWKFETFILKICEKLFSEVRLWQYVTDYIRYGLLTLYWRFIGGLQPSTLSHAQHRAAQRWARRKAFTFRSEHGAVAGVVTVRLAFMLQEAEMNKALDKASDYLFTWVCPLQWTSNVWPTSVKTTKNMVKQTIK